MSREREMGGARDEEGPRSRGSSNKNTNSQREKLVTDGPAHALGSSCSWLHVQFFKISSRSVGKGPGPF